MHDRHEKSSPENVIANRLGNFGRRMSGSKAATQSHMPEFVFGEQSLVGIAGKIAVKCHLRTRDRHAVAASSSGSLVRWARPVVRNSRHLAKFRVARAGRARASTPNKRGATWGHDFLAGGIVFHDVVDCNGLPRILLFAGKPYSCAHFYRHF